MRIELLLEKTGRQFQIDVPQEGKTLLTMLQEQRIYIDAPCGGNGTCGRCLVRFLEPDLGEQLACKIVPEWDCKIVLPDATEDMASLARDASGRENEADILPVGEHSYGIAVDIGTTTLAASLLDLNSKHECAVATAVNHQRAYGADVISRIQCANEGQGEILRNCICKDLTDLMENLVTQAGIRKEQVERVVIAANTTMCHLLRGLSCEGLGVAPYTPEDISLWEGTWDEWQAKVTILPGISAFVGGDIVAGLFACEMDERTETGFLLDIGTNGEMVLGDRDGFLVTSAAAGPVFEGGNISCGVPGIPGAVTHLTALTHQTESMHQTESTHQTAMTHQTASTPGCVAFETIGGQPPIGLCGTGIIDAMSLLIEKKLVDENGKLEEPWFTEGVVVAGDAIRFTQSDVREIQMGKSAIRSGIETLLGEYRKRGKMGRSEVPSVNEQMAEVVPESGAETPTGMDVFLAGGFGYDMNVKNAIRIGLFPAEFEGKVHPVGNSALEGAKKFLLSEEVTAKKRIERIVKNAEEINLALHPQFNELYLQYMFFEQ